MIVTDEKLGAFIDNELPAEEMDAIRDQIATDETLVDRIAQLSIVDHAVRTTLHAIDDKPLPDSVHQLFETEQPSASNVIKFPAMRKVAQTLREHVAIAAVFVLAIGVTVGTYFNTDSSNALDWSSVNHELSTRLSDQSVSLGEGWKMHLKTSFINTDENYCRLFSLQSNTSAHMNIACRQQDTWQLHSRIPFEPTQAEDYQTASVDPKINQLIDSTIKGSFLNQAQEQKAINRQWKNQ
ncbi:hypothetical protein GCM10009123_14250 [Kangiella japonica]|uniref:Uncharacterized protein n=1 Tax=Kangiella japonica TaxID=647384 RepID=A0ABP3CK70_9GAMM